TENLDIIPAFLAQEIDNGREKFDMRTVVTGDPNGAHILLNRGTDDISHRAMIAKINHFDPVPNELEIDRIDRAVVSVANRDSGQNSNGCSHLSPRANNKSGNQENRKTDPNLIS